METKEKKFLEVIDNLTEMKNELLKEVENLQSKT